MTKTAAINRRRVLSLVVAAAMVAATVMAMIMPKVATAAVEGSVTGQFGVNSADLTVDSVVLYNEYDNATAPSMDPTSTYVARVAVTDNSTLNFLDKIEVTVYYDEDGVFSTDNVPADGHAQNGVVMTWDGVDNWTLEGGTSSTWAIVTADCVDPTDMGAQNTFTFKFKFTVGTVAKESDDDAGDDAEWHIYAKAWDTTTPTPHDADNYQENLEMNWRGAITVALSAGSYLTFGDLALGTSDSASTNTVNGTYFSNGAYDRNIRTEGTWNGATYTVALDTAYDGSPDNGEFCLEADDDSGIDGAIAVQTGYLPIADTGTITGESGDPANGMTAWMTVASTGVNSDTYTGIVYYQISNGS